MSAAPTFLYRRPDRNKQTGRDESAIRYLRDKQVCDRGLGFLWSQAIRPLSSGMDDPEDFDHPVSNTVQDDEWRARDEELARTV